MPKGDCIQVAEWSYCDSISEAEALRATGGVFRIRGKIYTHSCWVGDPVCVCTC